MNIETELTKLLEREGKMLLILEGLLETLRDLTNRVLILEMTGED